MLKLPPTKNHHQLAAFINSNPMRAGILGRVIATVEHRTYNTDSDIPGTRLRRIGKGRKGLLLRIFPAETSSYDKLMGKDCLFSHNSGEAYRKHREARRWVEDNLTLESI